MVWILKIIFLLENMSHKIYLSPEIKFNLKEWRCCLTARLTFRWGTETCLGLLYHKFFYQAYVRKTNRINNIDNQVFVFLWQLKIKHIFTTSKSKSTLLSVFSCYSSEYTFETKFILDWVIKNHDHESKRHNPRKPTLHNGFSPWCQL